MMSRIFGEIFLKNHMMLFELLPFFEFCTLKFCKCDISESIIGRGSKLLSNYGPLTNKGMKFCKCRISKSIIARNLKLVSADRG